MRLFSLVKDFFAPKEAIYLDDTSSLKSVMKDLESNKLIAIDTEFIWRNTYFPKLSLVQISTNNKIYIFDCFSLDISFLEKVFQSKNIIKIFHSVRGDSSVIFNCLGIKIKNILDTQIAEDILVINHGTQISYKKLVKKYLFKDISKSETNSDWGRRPLKKRQLEYAADDVRYLHAIIEIQLKKIKKLNKFDMFKSLCERENKIGQEDFLISRLRRFKKKNKNISLKEIKIFSWREHEAKRLNVPPSHIFEDRNLKNLNKILNEKNLNEFKWIIKIDSSRDEFINRFL